MEEFLPAKHNKKTVAVAVEDTKLMGRSREEERRVKEAIVEKNEASSTLFSRTLETKISTVWVEFDEEDPQTSSFSFLGLGDQLAAVADDLLTEGESSTAGKAMHLL